jgi:hypothetical protein
MKRGLFIFTIVFLISITSALADYDYIGNDNAFYGSMTTFSDEYTSFGSSSNSEITYYSPVIRDVDRDGSDEMIVFYNTGYDIYSYPSLILEFNKDFSNEIMAYEVMDVTNDYLDEIIVITSDSDIHRSVWNGTHNISEAHINFYAEGGQPFSTYWALRCDDYSDKCLIIYVEADDFNNYVVASEIDPANFTENETFFNTNLFDTNGQWSLLFLNTAQTEEWCPPFINSIELVDYDSDNKKEWIFPFLDIKQSGTDVLKIYYFDPDHYSNSTHNNNTVYPELIISSNAGDVGQDGCIDKDFSGNQQNFLTNSLTTNLMYPNKFYTFVGVGYETDVKNFKYTIAAANTETSSITYFPKIDAVLSLFEDYEYSVSNLTNIFKHKLIGASIDNYDVCVSGFNSLTGNLDILCTNTYRNSGFVDKTELFTVNLNDSGFPDTGRASFENIVHNLNNDYFLTTNGIYNPYGADIYSDDRAYSMELIKKPSDLYTSVSVPNGNDLILYNDYLFFVYSGSAFNKDCVSGEQNCLTFLEINPYSDLPLCINNTMTIKMGITDADSDKVSARAIIYANSTNIQDSGWYYNKTSGSLFTFSFNLNKTVTNAQIILQYMESGDYGNFMNNETYYFSVIDAEPCTDRNEEKLTSIVSNGVSAAAENVTTPTDLTNNIIKSGLDSFTENFGIGTSILWFLITAAGAIIIFLQVEQINFKFGLLMLEIGGMTVLGYALGFISFIYIVLMMIVGFIVMAVTFSKMFTGNNGGG